MTVAELIKALENIENKDMEVDIFLDDEPIEITGVTEYGTLLPDLYS